MILDSSALLAIAFGEPEAPTMIEAILDAPALKMSAGNWLEMFIVIETRKRVAAVARLETFMNSLRLNVVDVTLAQAEIARMAYHRFGKGLHPASLNYGDCFAYALSKAANEPLLFKGNDFSQTDIVPALKS